MLNNIKRKSILMKIIMHISKRKSLNLFKYNYKFLDKLNLKQELNNYRMLSQLNRKLKTNILHPYIEVLDLRKRLLGNESLNVKSNLIT